MPRFLRITLIVAEMLTVPVAGCLYDFDLDRSNLTIRRLGVIRSASSDDLNPRKFRFRIPRASEIRDLIPQYRLTLSPHIMRSTAATSRQPSDV